MKIEQTLSKRPIVNNCVKSPNFSAFITYSAIFEIPVDISLCNILRLDPSTVSLSSSSISRHKVTESETDPKGVSVSTLGDHWGRPYGLVEFGIHLSHPRPLHLPLAGDAIRE